MEEWDRSLSSLWLIRLSWLWRNCALSVSLVASNSVSTGPFSLWNSPLSDSTSLIVACIHYNDEEDTDVQLLSTRFALCGVCGVMCAFFYLCASDKTGVLCWCSLSHWDVLVCTKCRLQSMQLQLQGMQLTQHADTSYYLLICKTQKLNEKNTCL